MASKGRRRRARLKRSRREEARTRPLDAHGVQAIESIGSLVDLVAGLSPDATLAQAELEAAYDTAAEALIEGVAPFESFRLIEVARMALLPWSFTGNQVIDTSAAAACVELIAMLSLIAGNDTKTEAAQLAPNAMSHFASGASSQIDQLLNLSTLRMLASIEPSDGLARVSHLVRAAQVLIRNSSYKEMTEGTLVELFDSVAEVRGALEEAVGFTAAEALKVLDACHDIQVDRLNERKDDFRDGPWDEVADTSTPTPEEVEELRAAWTSFFEPPTVEVTVTVDDLVDRTGIDASRINAVVAQFRLDLNGQTARQLLDDFLAGANPIRVRPLIATGDGRLMVAHPVLSIEAVKQNLEDVLKDLPVWNAYSDHRGDLLERRTGAVFSRLLPGATAREGFHYFVPANQVELASGDPALYTKRVEGDHLYVLDDLAVIVEDKAGAFSADARSGDGRRLRKDLASLISKAADQVGRLRDAIERDGGIRIKDEGWVDLSFVREIHTVAVSLDDLCGAATATAALLEAGVLKPDSIPWTVSLHDLELISQLADRPAEFLLYLRRRCNPLVTALYHAPDELDLLLYFYEQGLWVEPDPDGVHRTFPWTGPPTTSARRRYQEQTPAMITSRTDPLDAWFHKQRDSHGNAVAKPKMAPLPFDALIAELTARRDFGWLTIGATLMSGATAAQHKLERIPRELLAAPARNGQGRSCTVPFTTTTQRSEGWLLVWATRPAGVGAMAEESRLRDYLRAKMYQLGLPRGVVLLYDEGSKALEGVYYENDKDELPPELLAQVAKLKPPEAMQGHQHPDAKRRQRSRRKGS